MPRSQQYRCIPTSFDDSDFAEFILPHLSVRKKGPKPKLSFHKIFNYILVVLYTGCQWKMLPIERDAKGDKEIHYTRIYRFYQFWALAGCFDKIFVGSVSKLHAHSLLDLSILHGDGTTTAAKKGGDNIGYNGHKHMKGDKVVAICDRNCNVIAPFVAAPGNRNESVLLKDLLPKLTAISAEIGLNINGSVISLDGVYDSKKNRKAIFNRNMIPNINENKRNRKKAKRGRKRFFDKKIFKERFYTIERVFGWEDKFKRLLIRFERISDLHYAFKTLAYSLINLRNFC